MLSTKNVVTDIKEVPDTWIFEYFCKLESRLDGNEVNIKSVFNEKETKPSMFIFHSTELGKYWFHDFSTGKSGDAIRLVECLRRCSFGPACQLIRTEYMRYLQTNTYKTLAQGPRNKYRVVDYKTRGWNKLDANYWTPFNIGSELLEEYFVKPISWYQMTNESNSADTFVVQGEYMYGYFTPDGQLYKIYRPKKADRKFIKVMNYVQGIDQLKGERCLIVCSSLKDGLSLRSLKLKVDFIAPDSENSILSELIIMDMLDRYKGRVYTLLDNDDAGMRAMKLYRDDHNLSPILLPMAKDLSDSVRDFKPGKVRVRLIPKIDKLLNIAA